MKPVTYSRRSPAGSPKASIRRSCKTRRRCSISWGDAIHRVGENPRSDVVPLIGHLWGRPTICTRRRSASPIHDRVSTMLRSAVTLLACLAVSSASAAELTCKQWFEYGHRSHLPHGKSEPMAEIRAAVTATFDTIEVMRADLAKRAGQAEPRPHNVAEMQDAVISACQREQDREVGDVLADVRKAIIGLELATYPAATKP